MHKGQYGDIDYSRAPSLCMKRNRNAFQRNDGPRFKEWMRLAKEAAVGTLQQDSDKPKPVLHTADLLPHTVVFKACAAYSKQQNTSLSTE